MKKLLAVTIVFALVGGMALAQGFYVNSSGNNSASGAQSVELEIPERVALHIGENSIAHSLDALVAAPKFNLDDPNRPADGCGLVLPSQADAGFDHLLDLHTAVKDTNHDVDAYPAVVYNGATTEVAPDGSGGWLKGLLACFTSTQIQMFSNAELGWELSADVEVPTGAGKFGIESTNFDWTLITDATSENGLAHLLGAGTHPDLRLAYTRQSLAGVPSSFVGSAIYGEPTGGWLDADITQAFYLDGTETAGTKVYNVTYVLTGKF